MMLKTLVAVLLLALAAPTAHADCDTDDCRDDRPSPTEEEDK